MKPNAKARLFTQVLPHLMKHSPYFTHKAIQAAVSEAGIAIKDEVLNAYLSQAVKQGIIHDAGRGWYSRLSEPVKLDLSPCSKLVKELKKAFPLLDFTVWSTAQLNPWMHHLLAQPIAFLYVQRDTLETVGEALKHLGWEVAVNPGKVQATKQVRPGGRMVVLRPAHSRQPLSSRYQASVEQVLVELHIETERLALMGEAEATAVATSIMGSRLVQVSDLQMYAGFKRVSFEAVFANSLFQQK